jgi:hypothetical protein
MGGGCGGTNWKREKRKKKLKEKKKPPSKREKKNKETRNSKKSMRKCGKETKKQKTMRLSFPFPLFPSSVTHAPADRNGQVCRGGCVCVVQSHAQGRDGTRKRSKHWVR